MLAASLFASSSEYSLIAPQNKKKDPNSKDPNSKDPNSKDPHSKDPNSKDPHSKDPHSKDPHSKVPQPLALCASCTSDGTGRQEGL